MSRNLKLALLGLAHKFSHVSLDLVAHSVTDAPWLTYCLPKLVFLSHNVAARSFNHHTSHILMPG